MKQYFILFIIILLFIKANSQKMIAFQDETIPAPTQVDTVVTNFNTSQQIFKNLSSVDKEFYYWINYSRKNPRRFYDSVIIPLVKIYPQLKGENLNSLEKDLYNSPTLPLLTLNTILNKMAMKHAVDITSNNFSPTHNSSEGQTFGDRFKANNLKKCGSENISYGESKPIFLLCLLFIDLNISDLGHRKTLLNPALTETGIGSSFYKNGYIFLVEDFACSQN